MSTIDGLVSAAQELLHLAGQRVLQDEKYKEWWDAGIYHYFHMGRDGNYRAAFNPSDSHKQLTEENVALKRRLDEAHKEAADLVEEILCLKSRLDQDE